MAQPKTFSFGDFQVLVGNGASPEVFSNPCGFTQRSSKIDATAEETMVPDCDNEDAPVWPARDISSVSASVNGQGVMTPGAAPIWRNWMLGGLKKNVRVGPIGRTLADDGGYYQGSAVLTSLENVSAKGKRVTATIALASDGPWIWVPASA